MPTLAAAPVTDGRVGFHHEAFIYAGLDEFLAGTGAFIRDGLERDEPTLVVVSAEKIELLRDEFGPGGRELRFADMAQVGNNPARIIPAWSEFVSEHARSDRPLRGIGEPATPDRGDAELVECHRHEALLNLAFADARAFHLLCPYDAAALDPAAIAHAQRTHPFIARHGITRASRRYAGLELASQPFAQPLPAPPADAEPLEYRVDTMNVVRSLIMHCADLAGLNARRAEDMVLAVNEMATNSVRHGGGRGTLRVWQEPGVLLCEVRDAGQIRDPLVGRVRPTVDQIGGFGVWLANQVCDLVQISSGPQGTAIRLHMRSG